MARRVNHRWTEDEKQTITRLFNEGMTTRGIAECTGMPLTKVRSACSRLGLNRMGIPPNDYAAARRDQVVQCQSTDKSKERMRDYMREYLWEYRSRKVHPNPGVTP